MSTPPLSPSVLALRSSHAVRTRCRMIFDHVAAGKSAHYTLESGVLPRLASLVAKVTHENYPALEIPYHSRWGHFEPAGEGGVRMRRLHEVLSPLSPLERGVSLYDLVVVSVLLDAGAGMQWRYRDEKGLSIGRSEGLALASLDGFMAGVFSATPSKPLRVDATKLMSLTEVDLAQMFQVSPSNPMTGLAGRAQLLQRLGKALQSQGASCSSLAAGRPGQMFEALLTQAAPQITASQILAQVLSTLSPIWPGRLELHGHNLGDVWVHPAVVASDETNGLVPFHKLSQWLTYSLIEPLEWHGIQVTALDELTGLAEYRNGGLFLDGGAIVPRDSSLLSKEWAVGDLPVVEWRALTVSLLDDLAPLVRKELGLSADALPLAKVLQGGTWAAGRKLAAEKRADSSPPLRVTSDGTVF